MKEKVRFSPFVEQGVPGTEPVAQLFLYNPEGANDAIAINGVEALFTFGIDGVDMSQKNVRPAITLWRGDNDPAATLVLTTSAADYLVERLKVRSTEAKQMANRA